MSIYKSSSLAMIPTAYKDGKLYSIRPTDGSGDFTFSRGSNLAATRVDVNGLIEKGRENLLLQSNQFDTTWDTYRTTLTSGQSGYDGTNNAWLLTATDTFSARVQQSESLTGVQVLSVYAKAGTANFIVSEKAGTNGFYVWFDLSNGTIGNTSGDIDTTIEDVGNGWYKCSISGNPSASSKSQFYVAETNGSTTISVGASIYIQDAQLEQGLVATDYIETGTSAAQSGILEDMPRLDYSGSCPSLLLEPQRSNLYAQSEYIDSWSKQSVTIETNITTSPEGLINASKVIPTATNAFHAMYYSTTTSTSYVVSVFAKASGYNFLRVYDQFSSGVTPASFDLVNGTTSGGKIEDYGNGWYRCTAYGVNPSASTNIPSFTPSPDGTNVVFTGDGTSGVYLYGAQFELGNYPTSYIPTYGTSQTRSADTSSLTGVSDLYGSTQGVVFLQTGDCFNNGDTSPTKSFLIVEKDANNYFAIASGGANAAPTIRFVTKINGSVSTDAEPAGLSNSKIAIRYTEDDFKIYQNGVLQSTIAKSIGGYEDVFLMINSGDDMTMPLKQFALYPTALTDSECIALTTL